MKTAPSIRVGSLVMGLIVIVIIGIVVYMKHESSNRCEPANSTVPLLVSSIDSIYDKSKPIRVKVSITNTLPRQIDVNRSAFGLAERCGKMGFYIYDDKLRNRCNGHYISNHFFICSQGDIHLRPQQAMDQTIEIGRNRRSACR